MGDERQRDRQQRRQEAEPTGKQERAERGFGARGDHRQRQVVAASQFDIKDLHLGARPGDPAGERRAVRRSHQTPGQRVGRARVDESQLEGDVCEHRVRATQLETRLLLLGGQVGGVYDDEETEETDARGSVHGRGSRFEGRGIIGKTPGACKEIRPTPCWGG